MGLLFCCCFGEMGVSAVETARWHLPVKYEDLSLALQSPHKEGAEAGTCNPGILRVRWGVECSQDVHRSFLGFSPPKAPLHTGSLALVSSSCSPRISHR